MVKEETLKSGQKLARIEHMIGASTSDPIVLQAQSLQLALIGDHLGELQHRVIIQIVIVQEDLDQALIFNKSLRNTFKSFISNQIALQGQSCQLGKPAKAHLGDLLGTAPSNHIVRQPQGLQLDLVHQHLSYDGRPLTVDLIGVQTDIH